MSDDKRTKNAGLGAW